MTDSSWHIAFQSSTIHYGEDCCVYIYLVPGTLFGLDQVDFPPKVLHAPGRHANNKEQATINTYIRQVAGQEVTGMLRASLQKEGGIAKGTRPERWRTALCSIEPRTLVAL